MLTNRQANKRDKLRFVKFDTLTYDNLRFSLAWVVKLKCDFGGHF